jgi:prepilin-type N-terminal cleavage/methylation domain-containing protein
MLRKAGEAGFTLVELLVTMLILSIVMVIITGIFMTFNTEQYNTNTFLNEEANLFQVINQLNIEIREAEVVNGQIGTNVLYPQSSIAAMSTTIEFYILQNFEPVEWNFTNSGCGAPNNCLTRDTGTPDSSPPALGTAIVSQTNIAKGLFCYIDKAGNNMTGNPSCPGSSGKQYSSSNQIVTCAVEVYAIITTAPSNGVGPIRASIGIGLRNQTPQLVTEGAILPTGGPAAC